MASSKDPGEVDVISITLATDTCRAPFDAEELGFRIHRGEPVSEKEIDRYQIPDIRVRKAMARHCELKTVNCQLLLPIEHMFDYAIGSAMAHAG